MNLEKLFTRAILANELDGNINAALRFSDPDGVLTGKSGYSFGICQFDINNNPSAILCLRECGFTSDEIAGLRAQTIKNMANMDAQLKTAAIIVQRWDEKQLADCLTTPINLCRVSGIVLANDETRIHLADYHNQFYMSRCGKMHNYLSSMKAPIVPEMILAFKLSLPWGQKRPDDVHRRYNNIANLF